MTSANDNDVREVGQLKASIRQLREENLGLVSEIEDLRGQLAEARYLTPSPYDLPADVLAALTILLPGRPAARWRELARRIEETSATCSRALQRHR